MAESMQSRINSLQSGSLRERDFEKNDDPFSVGDDVRDAIDQLRGDSDWEEATDTYTSTVMRSGGKPVEALPQTSTFVDAARRDPIGMSQSLADHYKALPPGQLYQPKPDYDDPNYDFTKLSNEEIGRISLQQVKTRDAEKKAKAEAAEQFDQFRQHHGPAALPLMQTIPHLHKAMSEKPDDAGARLPVSIITDTMHHHREAAGLANAAAEIKDWAEASHEQEALMNNPRIRKQAARDLKAGKAQSLDDAFGMDSRNTEEDVQVFWRNAVEKMSPSQQAEYRAEQAKWKRSGAW